MLAAHITLGHETSSLNSSSHSPQQPHSESSLNTAKPFLAKGHKLLPVPRALQARSLSDAHFLANVLRSLLFLLAAVPGLANVLHQASASLNSWLRCCLVEWMWPEP